jgi:hypothetical protein
MSKYSIPVWKMTISVFKDENSYLTIKEIADKIHKSYPNENVNKMTIRLQTIFHCVNHPGKKNDVAKRWERNPLFFTDGKDGFRLLTDIEKKKYKLK